MVLDISLFSVGLLAICLLLLVVIVDLFFIPTAILSIFSSLIFFAYLFFAAFIKKQVFTASVLLAIFLVAGGLLGYIAKKKKLYKIISLQETVPRQTDDIQKKLQKSLLGKQGVAKTNLRPSGKVVIDGQVFDVIAVARQIEKGTNVQVVGSSGAQLTVKEFLL